MPSSAAIAASATPVESTAEVLTGILASVPDYASVETKELSRLVSQVYQGRVPKSLQLLLLLTADDRAYVVVAVDTTIDSFMTAGTVTGYTLPPLRNFPRELAFAQHVIVTDDISLMRPVRVTPAQVIEDPTTFAFTRVEMDTTYVFASVRIKDAPPSFDHIGFGAATDAFGSRSPDDYLTVVDSHNTEAQVRVANLTGTVLSPTPGMRSLLGQLLMFAPDDVDAALSKPSLFYEQLVDDEPQMFTISQLAPTIDDPTLKLRQFHGQMVSVQGLAVGSTVRSEDIPALSGLPVQLTAKLIGIEDQTGAMPIVGISSEDVTRELFGFFRFDLSVYAFDEDQTFAFLIRKEALPTDPVAETPTPTPASTSTLADGIALALPSVVRLVNGDRQWTGVMIDESGLILTTSRNLGFASMATFFTNSGLSGQAWVLGRIDDLDFALLEAIDPPEVFDFLEVGQLFPPAEGEGLALLKFPGASTVIEKTSRVDGLLHDLDTGLEYIQLRASDADGGEGAVLIDHTGRLHGIRMDNAHFGLPGEVFAITIESLSRVVLPALKAGLKIINEPEPM